MKPFLWDRKKKTFNENRCVKQRGKQKTKKNQRPLCFFLCPVFVSYVLAHGTQWSCH